MWLIGISNPLESESIKKYLDSGMFDCDGLVR